jgi:hypothetical protein
VCSANELAFADRWSAELVDALPASAALLVTSDHGQIHLDADFVDRQCPSCVALADHVAGDGRFRYLYAAPGGGRAAGPARELVSDRAWVWSRAELLDMGVLGADATGTCRARSATSCSRRASRSPSSTPRCPNERSCDPARQSHAGRDVRAVARDAGPRLIRLSAPRSPW